MITGKKEELDQIVGTHRCPLHPDKALVVTWLKDHGYAIRCGADHYPEEVTLEKSPTELFKLGEPLHPAVEENVKKGLERRAARRPAAEVYKELGITPATDLATGEVLEPDKVQLLVHLAKRYGLDLFRGHMCIMYGQPYVTLDGYLWHADRTNVPYTLVSRPLSSQERQDYMISDGDHAWLATAVKLPSGSTFNGLGTVTLEEMTAKSKRDSSKLRSPVVAAHPWQLAQKRAEWQAMRRAFPIGIETEKDDGE